MPTAFADMPPKWKTYLNNGNHYHQVLYMRSVGAPVFSADLRIIVKNSLVHTCSSWLSKIPRKEKIFEWSCQLLTLVISVVDNIILTVLVANQVSKYLFLLKYRNHRNWKVHFQVANESQDHCIPWDGLWCHKSFFQWFDFICIVNLSLNTFLSFTNLLNCFDFKT